MPATIPFAAAGRRLPLIGRAQDLEGLHTLFGDHRAVEPCRLLTGETGVGKSRLVEAVRDEAVRRGWAVVSGRAYPVETGVPYAVFSDAFLPLFREMESGRLEVLTRGGRAELQRLFPPLGEAPEEVESGADPGELRTRLFWNFSELLKRLASRQPLLVLLEDLHWAAPSTLGLLHFVVRQLSEEPVRILGTYNTDHRDQNPRLIELERSLLSLRRVQVHLLRPLTAGDTTELLFRTYGARGPAVDEFSSVLYGWTKGNPYFMEQTLDQLMESGRLYQRDGTWLGWEAEELELAPTVRDAVLARLSGAGSPAVTLAETLSVAGGRCTLSVLARAAGLDGVDGDGAAEALVALGLLEEVSGQGGEVDLRFRHPLVREALYQRLSLVRRGRVHGTLAEVLEERYAGAADEHADELAYHFSRSGETPGDERAARYLAAAGRTALARHADREAVTYLQEALIRSSRLAGADEADLAQRSKLTAALAKGLARLGRYEEARALWEGMLDEAERRGDDRRVADAHRRLALFASWSGDPNGALHHHQLAVRALAGRDPSAEARLHLAAGVALQELGRPAEARERLEQALPLAESASDQSTLARIHWALALVRTWVGEANQAREHGWKAIALAKETGDPLALFRARWVLAALEGLTGDTKTMRGLMASARADAEDLGSPVLRLWVTELEVRYAWATGDWDRAIAEGEAAISLGQALNQRVILARLMVWTGAIYVERGNLERARALIEEAWHLSGADAGGLEGVDVHAVVPAYVGRTALALGAGDYEEAIAFGETALEIADRSGYVTWALDLLPQLMEAYIRTARFDEVAGGAARLRKEAARMGHPLARAWAKASDALVAWLSGEEEDFVASMEEAARGLESVPILFAACRLRRQLAGRLADQGRDQEALGQLRRVHEAFAAMGAQPELEKTREMFRELGSRPPPMPSPDSGTWLTPREDQVAKLVASRHSNKAIAKQLGIAERTVTTHLSNIYRKVGVRTRGELSDMVREARLPSKLG